MRIDWGYGKYPKFLRLNISGNDGFYVDDKAIRPDEFINLSFSDINKLVGNE